jgi:hypothetical protein
MQHAVHTRISFKFSNKCQILCYLYVYGRERPKFSELVFNPIVNNYNKICSNQTKPVTPAVSQVCRVIGFPSQCAKERTNALQTAFRKFYGRYNIPVCQYILIFCQILPDVFHTNR